MRTPIEIAVGSVAALVIFYGGACFVHADLNWLRDIWEWNKSDRFFLMYAVLMIAVLGGAATRLLRL